MQHGLFLVGYPEHNHPACRRDAPDAAQSLEAPGEGLIQKDYVRVPTPHLGQNSSRMDRSSDHLEAPLGSEELAQALAIQPDVGADE
jgi:hypothetical protein